MLFGKTKAKLESKFDREKARWKNPLTPDGAHLSNAEAVIFVAVFVVILLVASLMPPIPLIHLLVFSVGVLALSSPGRATLMPIVYGYMAKKFGWSPYEKAIAAESAAREAEKVGQVKKSDGSSKAVEQTVAPVIKQAVQLTSMGREVLESYVLLPRAERLARVEQVSAFLIKDGAALVLPERDEEAPEDFPKDIDRAIREFARSHGIEAKKGESPNLTAEVAHA